MRMFEKQIVILKTPFLQGSAQLFLVKS